MKNILDKTVTAVITDYVDPKQIKKYDEWVVRINKTMATYDGFIALEITKPSKKNSFEYNIVFRFESSEKLEKWHQSKTFHSLLEEGKKYMAKEPKIHFIEGLEILFDHTQHRLIGRPKYYKQVIISIMCVYPLILGVNFLLKLIPGMDSLPFPVFLFISVIFVSMLMAKPVMPLATKLLDKWLYDD